MIPMFPPSEGEITTLKTQITPKTTNIEVADVGAFPQAPNVAVIGDGYRLEVIMYNGIDGNTLTDCQRGLKACTQSPTGYKQEEGLARAWGAGIDIQRLYTSIDHTGIIRNVEEAFEMAKELNLMQLAGRFTDHALNTQNPHQTTKAHIGLANADNTSDIDKPISNATLAALENKQNLQPNLVLVHEGLDFNEFLETGFYELLPVAPAVFPRDFRNSPGLGSLPAGAYPSLVLHVFKGQNTNIAQTPAIYQVAHVLGDNWSSTTSRASRDNGKTWTPWSVIEPTSPFVQGTWEPRFVDVTPAQIEITERVNSRYVYNKILKTVTVETQITLTRRVATTDFNLVFEGLPFPQAEPLHPPTVNIGVVTFSTSGITHSWYPVIEGSTFRIVRPNHVQATVANVALGATAGNFNIMRLNMTYLTDI